MEHQTCPRELPPNHVPFGNVAPPLDLLRTEMELLLEEEAVLKRVTGAAALFIAQLEGSQLPPHALHAARHLAELLNTVPDDTLREAFGLLRN